MLQLWRGNKEKPQLELGDQKGALLYPEKIAEPNKIKTHLSWQGHSEWKAMDSVDWNPSFSSL